MGSTNKTQYLELPQWVGTDHPTWLGDMNDAFLKIDKGYNTIDGNSTTAISQSGQAVQVANEAKQEAKTANTKAAEADKNAGTALSTANNALNTANNTQTQISNITNSLTAIEEKTDNLNEWNGGNMSPYSENVVTTPSFATAYFNPTLKLFNIIVSTFSIKSTIKKGDILFTLPSVFSQIVRNNRTLYSTLMCRFNDGTFSAVNLQLKNNSSSIQLLFDETISREISSGSINILGNYSFW